MTYRFYRNKFRIATMSHPDYFIISDILNVTNSLLFRFIWSYSQIYPNRITNFKSFVIIRNLLQRQISLYSKLKLYILDRLLPKIEIVKLNTQMDIQSDAIQALPRPISLQTDLRIRTFESENPGRLTILNKEKRE